MPPAPWSRRVLNAIPPMQDRLWVGILLFTIFMCGAILGLTLRDLRRAAMVPEHFPLQHQLNSLEQRVRALEQR
jgi:hypothetical protein